MNVMKLDRRLVVISEGHVVRAIMLPAGVCYDEVGRRFIATVWNDGIRDRECYGICQGAFKALELAMQARKESVPQLITKRALKHQVKDDLPGKSRGRYVIWDPVFQEAHYASTIDGARRIQATVGNRYNVANHYEENL